MSNLLIMHGGAPTSVINSSLAGALTQIRKNGFKGKILAARYGSKGLVNEDFIDLTNISDADIKRLKDTPGSAIGTSRYPLEKEDYIKISEILEKHDIKYVLVNGGNGSMDTCGNIAKYSKGKEIYVVGIPKTIDNDIMETDHAPGYASAARYIAASVREAICDISGLPIHVSVIESMGRNVGWITAAAALSSIDGWHGPDLLYLPENLFDENKFLCDAERLFRQKGGVCVVASEGLKGLDGKPVVEPVLTVGRATYFGDVSAHLQNLILKNLGIKARSEKPGLLQRCSYQYASKVDREEAFIAGEEAAKAVLSNISEVMVGFERISTTPYIMQTKLVPIEKVMLTERTFPDEFFNEDKNNVSDKFIEWAKPLIGELPEFKSFII